MSKARLETDYVIAFRPLPDQPGGPNAIQRLRSLLKAALQSYGLKCITIAPGLPSELPAVEDALNVERSEPPFAAGG